MTPKRTLPKNLLKDIKPANKVWFEKYKSESDSQKKYYQPNVQEFLEFCSYNSEKEIIDIDRTDIDSYIAALKQFTDSPYTINRRISAISFFRKFLCSKYPDVFGEKFLSDLPSHEHTDENPTDIKALSLKQLSYARKYNRRSVKDEYIFELFFQLGIDKKKLIACTFSKDRNPQIDEIIKKVSKGKVTDGTINSYFSRITTYLKKQGIYEKSRRNINSYDLTESHKSYFFQCPNCKKTFENTANYWVLAKVKFENSDYQDEYRIVCAQCKGVLDES
jgi:site-specific recombinase XerD